MKFKRGVENNDGIFNARYGKVNGVVYTFAHRDPDNGRIYGETDCQSVPEEKRCGWFNSDSVEFLD